MQDTYFFLSYIIRPKNKHPGAPAQVLLALLCTVYLLFPVELPVNPQQDNQSQQNQGIKKGRAGKQERKVGRN